MMSCKNVWWLYKIVQSRFAGIYSRKVTFYVNFNGDNGIIMILEIVSLQFYYVVRFYSLLKGSFYI